jgi:hypothetical protein
VSRAGGLEPVEGTEDRTGSDVEIARVCHDTESPLRRVLGGLSLNRSDLHDPVSAEADKLALRNGQHMLSREESNMPIIDDGPTDGPPGRELKSAWVTFSPAEAREVLEALKDWADEIEEGRPDPGWHTHVTDELGNELTIAIGVPEAFR